MEILFGSGACRRLSEARVLLCGLGAVGGFAAEILARSGVGRFLLADSDAFDATNVNRQIGALESTIGRRKTEVMRARILDINPEADVSTSDTFIDETSIPGLLEWRPCVAVDAIDTIASKISLMEAAFSGDIRLVASMGAARRTDAGRVKTGPLSRTHSCPVASRIRKGLRALGSPADFPCVFSDEAPSPQSHLAWGGADSKKIIGSSPAVTAVFGVMLADLAIREILNDAL